MKKLLFIALCLVTTLCSAQLNLPFGIDVLTSKPVDAKYYNNTGATYTGTAQVLSELAAGERSIGLTVNVSGVEYWFKDGITNGDLVEKLITFTLASGNGTTANGNSVDVGGNATNDIIITTGNRFKVGGSTNFLDWAATDFNVTVDGATKSISLNSGGNDEIHIDNGGSNVINVKPTGIQVDTDDLLVNSGASATIVVVDDIQLTASDVNANAVNVDLRGTSDWYGYSDNQIKLTTANLSTITLNPTETVIDGNGTGTAYGKVSVGGNYATIEAATGTTGGDNQTGIGLVPTGINVTAHTPTNSTSIDITGSAYTAALSAGSLSLSGSSAGKTNTIGFSNAGGISLSSGGSANSLINLYSQNSGGANHTQVDMSPTVSFLEGDKWELAGTALTIPTTGSITSKAYVLGAKTFTGKQTFVGTSTLAPLNLGSIAGNPSSFTNGDIWHNTTANHVYARINGTSYQLDQQSVPLTNGSGTTAGSTNIGLGGNLTGNVFIDGAEAGLDDPTQQKFSIRAKNLSFVTDNNTGIFIAGADGHADSPEDASGGFDPYAIAIASGGYLNLSSGADIEIQPLGNLQLGNIPLDASATQVLTINTTTGYVSHAAMPSGGGGGGTVSNVTITQPAAGITVTNSGVAQTPTPSSTIALANDLAGLEGLSSTGMSARTATDTWALRTITGTTNQITVTNGGGVAGNPTLSLPSSLVLPSATTATTQSASNGTASVATCLYVDNAILGQRTKEATKYASTAALPSIVYANGSSGVGATITGVALAAISLDGSSPSLNDRVLIKNQASTFQNGIYTVTQTGSGVAVFILTRAVDFDQAADIQTGDNVFITSGSTLGTTTWTYNAGDNPVMGTDPITFVQIAGQGSFTSGNGITITGTSIAINTSVTVDKTTAQALTNKDLTSGTNTFPTLNQNTTGSAATLTTSRAIYGNNFNGGSDLSQIIASTYGGTGNGFTKFTGPSASEKTFTLPDASATILTNNAAVTVGQGGTNATSAGITAFNNISGYTASGATGTTSTNLVFSTGAALTDPTSNTQSSSDNSTKVATDAFVKAAAPKYFPVACSDLTTALTTGTGKAYFRVPKAFTITDIRASLLTAQASGSILTIDIKESGTTIFSTKPTFDNTEKTTTTAATAYVLSDTSLADDAEITFDISQVGTSGAAGLIITIIGY